MSELYAMREVLEGAAAAFAVKHATPAEVANMGTILDEHDESADPVATNIAFHDAIYGSAYNRHMSRSLQSVADSTYLLGSSTLANTQRAQLAKVEYRQIFEAISSGDAVQAASSKFRLSLDLDLDLGHDISGHESLAVHGATITPALLQKVRDYEGLMLGPMATYDLEDEAMGEINPSKFFRKELGLFAIIRPARIYPGMAARFGSFDLVLVRENTEGFYADRNIESGGSEMLIPRDVVVLLRRIPRRAYCARGV